jgi:hypothetical protein
LVVIPEGDLLFGLVVALAFVVVAAVVLVVAVAVRPGLA